MRVRKEVRRVSAARRSLAVLGCLALLAAAACGGGGSGNGNGNGGRDEGGGDAAALEDVSARDLVGADTPAPRDLPGADVPQGVDTPGPGPDVPAAPDAVTPPAVVVNEVVARAPAGGADWVELYNPTLAVVDLGGWVLRDSGEDIRFVFPSGTAIQAGGFLVLDGPGGMGALVFEFGLGSEDSVRLFDRGSVLVDSTSWTAGDAPEGGSWGRYPDGFGAFRTLRQLTRGEPNALGGPAPPNVVVNEVVARAADAGPDWIELYNAGEEPADLAGWTLRDENDSASLVLPAGTTVGPGAFLLLEGPGGTTEPTFGFGLGAADAVRLFDAGGVVVDRTSWSSGQAPEGTSWGRYPDGSGAFRTLALPTPGAANSP
jgi:hypothetical protein